MSDGHGDQPALHKSDTRTSTKTTRSTASRPAEPEIPSVSIQKQESFVLKSRSSTSETVVEGAVSTSTKVMESPENNSSTEKVGLKVEMPTDGTSCPLLPSPSVSGFPNSYFFRSRRKSTDLNDYFVGPREFDRHSKWPMWMRIHGSVLPKMIVPIFFVGAWASAISSVHHLAHPVGLSNVLLTVLGFVVGLALSFRNSTAYERYAEGRKFWQMLSQTSYTLARTIWVNVHEREEHKIEDLLNKISALNLIASFAHALRHRLRFEPYISRDELFGLVNHLDTLARSATEAEAKKPLPEPEKRKRIRSKIMKAVHSYGGDYLGLPFVEENPRATLKAATEPVGNLPLEILSYLSVYIEDVIAEGMLPVSSFQVHAANSLLVFNEVLAGCERILNTPLPLAYSIAISQITWLYIMVLPFQLVEPLGWLAIPGTLVAGYIILGMQLIGMEVENPFGNDVNDLPLEQFCSFITKDIDIIASREMEKSASDYMAVSKNKVLFPASHRGYNEWKGRDTQAIHQTLKSKTWIGVRPVSSPAFTPPGTRATSTQHTLVKPTPQPTFNMV